MFALDSIYHIVFFAVACGITVFFLAGCIGAVCVHKKKLRVCGLLYNIVAIVLWAAVLLLAAALILLKLQVVSVDGDALLLWGLRVPELGHVLRLCEFTVGMILLGAAIVLGALAFILNFCRRPSAILTPEAAAESDGQAENAADEPQQSEESDAPTAIEERVEEVAADATEEVEAQESAADMTEEVETPEPAADMTEEVEAQESAADATEEVEAQESAADATEEVGADIEEEGLDAAQEPAAETESIEMGDDADAPFDIPEYQPKVNKYRDLLGQINDVLDDAISGVQPEEVKAEVVAVKRTRKTAETKEVSDEEIALVGYDTLQALPIRTIVRRTNASDSKTTATQKTVTPQKPPHKRPSKANEEVAVTHDAVATGEALMTRRHVIMNRSNVVNMFSEYFKSPNDEEKERLEDSINTIIIK